MQHKHETSKWAKIYLESMLVKASTIGTDETDIDHAEPSRIHLIRAAIISYTFMVYDRVIPVSGVINLGIQYSRKLKEDNVAQVTLDIINDTETIDRYLNPNLV